MKHYGGIFIMLMIAFLYPRSVYGSYVLPYPSYMPGNTLYRVSRIIDRLKAPLYFGSISSYKYHQALSDKYLVEAKTLFEYKQYLLAADALGRSDREFAEASVHVRKAGYEGKDVTGFLAVYRESAGEHIRILEGLRVMLPEEFTWSSEKSGSTDLYIGKRLDSSVRIRSASSAKGIP